MRLGLSDVRIVYPGFTLGPVTVELQGPGLVSIVGPSGSGKSTLLSLVAGLMPPATGSVTYDGTDLRPLGDAARARFRRAKVAVAVQQPYFLPELDLAANLGFARCREPETWLARVDLSAQARQAVTGLSGGEQARANAVRALGAGTPLVCLDEPTAMLDERNAAEMRALIAAASRDRLVVVATHDLDMEEHSRELWRLERGVFRPEAHA